MPLVPTASRKLPGGAGTLHASEYGERWITPEGATTAVDGGAGPHTETAPFVLPERIVGILSLDQRWAFFGSSGRTFIAATPLGPIDEVRPRPAAVRSVSAGSVAAVAATQTGDLLRTTDGGAHWSAVQTPGLSPAVPYQVALGTDGAGVLLAAPQRAFVTADDGATWTPLALPGGGPPVLDRSDEGEVWLNSTGGRPERTFLLSGKPPALVAHPAPPQPERPRRNLDGASYEHDWRTQRAVVGKRLINVGRPNNREPFKMQISDLDQVGEWQPVPFEGCEGSQIVPAGFGDDLYLGCTRRLDASVAADGGAAAPFRMVIYRSTDAGASWKVDGEVPLGDEWAALHAGPEGAIAVRSHGCKDRARCSPLVLRAANGQPFVPLETAADTDYLQVALDPARRRLVALTSRGAPKAARITTWSFDGHVGKVTELFPSESGFPGDVAVDEQGAIVVVTRVQKREPSTNGPQTTYSWKVLRSTDDGATFAPESLPEGITVQDVALVGDRGLIVDTAGHHWETATAGRTWVPVAGLHWMYGDVARCGREGCALGANRRLGWDLASGTSPTPAVSTPAEVKVPVPGAAPLRCAMGESKEIPGVLVDDLDDLAVPAEAGGRLAIPAATKALGLEIVVVSAAEGHVTAKAAGVFDAPPNRAATGSATDVQLAPAGILASRSTYPVDSHGADVWHSPVSGEIAWWRPQTGKVVHGRIPPLGKGYMRGTLTLGERNVADKNELFSLTSDSVIYRPAIDRARELFTFPDKGASTKITTGILQGATSAVRTPAGLALLELPAQSQDEGVVRFAFAPAKPQPKDARQEAFAAWMMAPPTSRPVFQPLQRGNDGAVVVAWSGPPDGPPRGYVVPVRAGDAPSEVTDLGLASLLVERPRACGEAVDPASARIIVGLPRSVRRAMVVEGGPKPLLVRADAVTVVVPPQGPACVSEWVAHGAGSELAIIPVAAPQRAWVIVATPTDWADGVRSRNLTVTSARCEEAPGLQIPASFEWKGF